MQKRLVGSYFLAFLITSLMLAATLLFWNSKKQELFNNQENLFLKSTNNVAEKISNRITGYELILNGIKGFYENSEFVTRNEYINYVRKINFEKNGNGLLAISLVQFITAHELNNYDASMRKQGYENFMIRPEGVRSGYAPISYIYPESEENLKVVGFDLLTKPGVSSSLIQSRDSGRIAMTGQIMLAQDLQNKGDYAQVIYVPIYNTQKSIKTQSERALAIAGWVSAPFRFRDLMSTLPNPLDDGINLDIYEGKVIENTKHLYGTGQSHKIKQNEARFFTTRIIDIGGQQLTLSFSTLPKFEENFNVTTHNSIAIVGIFCSILSGWLVGLMGIGRNKAILLAEQITKDIKLNAKIFESSKEGFFITDAHNKIISINQGFTQITGYTSKDAIGKNPSILSSGMQDAKFYKEMWSELIRLKHWQGELWNRRKNGDIYPEWLSISAVVDEKDQITNYVGVFLDFSEREKAEETIHYLSFYDKLTALPNRQLLLDHINDCIKKSQENNSHFALLYIDIDHFKRLNETMGYEYGDLLLMEISYRIKSSLSKSNTISRLGGDEFVVLIDDMDQDKKKAVASAQELAEQVFNAIKQPFSLNSFVYFISACIGISLFRDVHESPVDILKLAEISMSQAKRTGRDKIHFLDNAMQLEFENRIRLESSLRKAIPNELALYFQPQVDSKGKVFGAEALIRWQSEESGLISPASFIPVAEESELILPIGQWVIDSACKQLKSWESDQRTSDLILAVNISPRQFRQDDFVQQVLNSIGRFSVNPNRLKLEITESLLLKDMNSAIEKMKLLKEKGIRISLDDFGTGYSSLSYLKLLPLNQLKIDQSFVRSIDADPTDRAISRAIVVLGDTLDLNVMAEGVETSEQRNSLIECGCHNFQGYYFSKPLTIDDFQKYLLSSA